MNKSYHTPGVIAMHPPGVLVHKKNLLYNI